MILAALALLFMIDLPNHGGVAYVQGSGAHAYQYEGTSSGLRLLVSPALTEAPAALLEMRTAGTSDGHCIIEPLENGGPGFDLVPGDPELQIECASGAWPTEVRLYTVTIRTVPEYLGRTSEVLFEIVEQ